jgi:hypothetical protein
VSTKPTAPPYDIQSIKYFTANVKPTRHNPAQNLRQQIYFWAMQTNPKIEIHLGHVGPLAMLSQRTDGVLGLILPENNQAKGLLALQLPIIRKIRMGVL